MSRKFKIAMVKGGKYNGGGVSSVSWFLYQTLLSVERYELKLFSIDSTYNSPANVRLLSPQSWFQGTRIDEYTWRSIPVTHIGTKLSEFEFQRYMPCHQLTDLLNQFDLIQIVAGGPAIANVVRNIGKPACLFIATLARLERKSILQKANSLRKIYGYVMLPIVSMIEIQVLKQVDYVFAETEYTRQAILPYIGAARVAIDTIGVDTQQFQPVSEEQRTNDYILSVGRFGDARKNIVLLFEAYALLRQRMSDAPRLILAGETGPTSVAWSRARELRITQYIVFKKGVSFDELVTLYQNAAFFVLSSDEEGLGIVLLEAMACATPVVSTRCGGPNTVISDQIGFLTPVGDAPAMAERMQWLLQNPLHRREMGQGGRQMVESRFSNKVVSQKYLDVYDKLLGVNLS